MFRSSVCDNCQVIVSGEIVSLYLCVACMALLHLDLHIAFLLSCGIAKENVYLPPLEI